MKIPLSKGKMLGAERDIAFFTVIGSNLNLSVSAIVDTGSPVTIISESDLKRSRLPYTQLPKQQIVSLGPIKLGLVDLGECTLIFRDMENNPLNLNHKMFGGIFMQRNIELSQTLPSILGRDFLVKYNFDIKRDEHGNVYLQT